MKESTIINEFINRGYNETFAQDFIKNGVTIRGISLRKTGQKVSPVFYLEEKFLSRFPSVNSLADFVEMRISEQKGLDLAEIQSLMTGEKIKESIRVGCQKAGNEPLLKRPSGLPGIELYAYLAGEIEDAQRWRIKLHTTHLKSIPLTENELWDAAERNSFTDDNFDAVSICDLLGEINGQKTQIPLFSSSYSLMPLYVITNKERSFGAVQIFNSASLRKWAAGKGIQRIVMLPSSLHEVIVMSVNDSGPQLAELSQMVQEINHTVVDAIEQLADKAYIMDIK